MKAPFWATREFRWLAAGVLIAGTAVVLYFVRIRPDLEAIRRARQGEAAAQGIDALAPAQTASRLPPDEVLAGLLAEVSDAQPLGGAPDAAYLRLADYTSRLDPAVLQAEARHIRYELYRRAPASLRGRAVALTALLIDWKPISLSEKAGNIDLVYRLYLLDTTAREGYVADVLAPPPANLRSRSLVSLEGLFLRTCVYEAQQTMAEAPLLIGREARVAAANYGPAPFETSGGMVGLVILSVALLIVLYWVQRQIAARRRVALAPPRLPAGALPPPRLPPPAPRTTFRWRKPPRVQGTGPRPDLSALTRRQQRRLLVFTIAAFVVLVALTAYTLYERYREPEPVTIDLAAETARWFSRAEAVRQEIAVVANRAAVQKETLGEADRARLAPRLKLLERSWEAILNLRESARQADPRGFDATPAAAEATERLLVLQLWVLDASDLLASIGQPQAGGYFVPLHGALERSRAAREALDLLEKEIAAGTLERPAAMARIAAAEAALLEARQPLLQLETYVARGLTLDAGVLDRIADARPLREELRLLAEALERVKKLAG